MAKRCLQVARSGPDVDCRIVCGDDVVAWVPNLADAHLFAAAEDMRDVLRALVADCDIRPGGGIIRPEDEDAMRIALAKGEGRG